MEPERVQKTAIVDLMENFVHLFRAKSEHQEPSRPVQNSRLLQLPDELLAGICDDFRVSPIVRPSAFCTEVSGLTYDDFMYISRTSSTSYATYEWSVTH
jgi:hypothetical protein